MSDLKLAVQATKTLEFTPNRLLVSVDSQNILTGESIIYYELYDDSLDNSRYHTRSWIDTGKVVIPTSVLIQAVDTQNKTFNIQVFDMILAPFNLILDSNTPVSFTEESIVLDVLQTKTFVFSPNQLMIRTVNSDILTAESLVYFELIDTTLDNSRYLSRTWVDRGSVFVPTALLVQAVDSQSMVMNQSVTNYFLEEFNLEITSVYPIP